MAGTCSTSSRCESGGRHFYLCVGDAEFLPDCSLQIFTYFASLGLRIQSFVSEPVHSRANCRIIQGISLAAAFYRTLR